LKRVISLKTALEGAMTIKVIQKKIVLRKKGIIFIKRKKKINLLLIKITKILEIKKNKI